jgi:hypothetical protein
MSRISINTNAAYKLVAEEQEERNKALKQSQTTPTH